MAPRILNNGTHGDGLSVLSLPDLLRGLDRLVGFRASLDGVQETEISHSWWESNPVFPFTQLAAWPL